MLQRAAVTAGLLELLGQLMKEEMLSSLRLVGGTALALQIGHRNSVDIDLFGKHDLDDQQFGQLFSQFKKVQLLRSSKSIKVYLVEGIKVDIVNYSYPWLAPIVLDEGIRMAALEDIAAMKIAAITQRGSKKDFIDLYFLLKVFSLEDILHFYEQKITDSNEWMALRSMAFFQDADVQPTPLVLKGVSWEEIKRFVLMQVREYSGW
jgi:hypothetical protein